MSKTVTSMTSGVGAAVSGGTGSRIERRANGAARWRGGASLAALLAAGALLAGCGAAAPEAADSADREPAPAAAPVDGSAAAPADDAAAAPADDAVAAPAEDAAGNAAGAVKNGDSQGKSGDSQGENGDSHGRNGTTKGGQDEGQDGSDQGQRGDDQGQDGDDQGQDGDDQGEDEQGGDPSPTTPAVALPASWTGTYSTEAVADGGYLVMQNLYGDDAGIDSIEGSRIQGMEFFGSMGATCEGTATLAGDTADCIVTDDGRGSGPTTAVVHLVPTAFDSSALLIEVGVTDGLGVADAPQGIGSLSVEDPARMTEADADGAVLDAVMMAEAPDGDVPEELDAQCELLDGGQHALCEVTGTPDGCGDGTWYGTVQTGYSWPVVLFTQLPA